MTIYYKVVTGHLFSALSPYHVKYVINQYVQSPVKYTPLCVFKTLEQAKSFKNEYALADGIIYTCKIKNICRKPWLPILKHNFQGHSTQNNSLRQIQKLIKNKKSFIPKVRTDLPIGTVAAKYVMLLERVTNV